MCSEDWFNRINYYIIEVGDDPGDETVHGPYKRFHEVIGKLYDNFQLYVNNPNGPNLCSKNNIIGFHSAISSVYVIWGEGLENPSYETHIRFKQGESYPSYGSGARCA